MSTTTSLINLDGTPGTMVLAQYDPSVRWNGWLCPRIDAHSAVRVLEYLNSQDEEGLPFDFDDAGNLIVEDPTYWDDEGYAPDVFTPDADGLYDLGAFGWVWSRIDEDGTLPDVDSVDAVGLDGSLRTQQGNGEDGAFTWADVTTALLGGTVEPSTTLPAVMARTFGFLR